MAVGRRHPTVARLLGQWRADTRGLHLDRAAFDTARAPFDGARLADAAEKIEKPAFTRADPVEIIGAQLPVDSERTPRELVESAVDEIGVRLTAPRAAHQREGHERFTLDRILAEEMALLELADARDDRAQLWVKDEDTADLSAQQAHAVREIARWPQPRAARSAKSWCWRRRARRSTSPSAKAPASTAAAGRHSEFLMRRRRPGAR